MTQIYIVFYSCRVQNIFLAVFTSAVRSSLRRQQYKIGLIDEFINTTVTVMGNSIVKSLLQNSPSVNKINIGK